MARSKKQPKLAPEVSRPRMGVLSNLFRGTPEQVAERMLDYDLETVQLFPAFTGIKLSSNQALTPALCEELVGPFLDRDLEIAAVTAHTPFLEPDHERRDRLVQKFNTFIANIEYFHTPFLVTETGTLADEPWSDHPDNHKPETLNRLIEAMKPSAQMAADHGAVILIKAYVNHIVSTPERAAQLCDALGDSVAISLDPANLVTRKQAGAPKTALRQIFKVIGPYCQLAHAKDVRVVAGDVTTPRAGTGLLDFKLFLELLDEYHPQCPMILEQIRPEELRETLDFLDRFYETPDQKK